MALAQADVVVLGAGMVGVSAALHAQARGRDVVIIDRAATAASETSYGNAGIVQSEAAVPYMFPRKPAEVVRAALNLDPRVQIRYSSLPSIAPWIARYFIASSKKGTLASARAQYALVAHCVPEHNALADAAGASALLRPTGWIKSFRTAKGQDLVMEETRRLQSFGVDVRPLDREALRALEPHISELSIGGVHYASPWTTSDPAALAQAYAALFVKRGGRFIVGDARSLGEASGGWSVMTIDGSLFAKQVVVALGPWSTDVLRMFGYRIPLGSKRGYHMHYGTTGNTFLNRPVLDSEFGYMMAPMARGLRLTTGVEFARRDDPPSPAHLERVEPHARELFPLAERRDPEPWLGRRPSLPDMLPVIGPAPRHKGLWMDFGHQHLGLTLGPVSGRLLAEMMAGEKPLVDPAPYSAARFG
jgi:D-amino-acid dehydrogenase